MASVVITRNLLAFFPQLADEDLSVEATTVAAVIAELERRAPGFAFYVCDELGRLRTHVNVFVGEERVNDRTRLTDAVGPDTRVFIMQALSGG